MHRFAGPIRVIELLAMFDEMHPSINNAACKQRDKVPHFSFFCQYIVLALEAALQHSIGNIQAVYMICSAHCHRCCVHVCHA